MWCRLGQSTIGLSIFRGPLPFGPSFSRLALGFRRHRTQKTTNKRRKRDVLRKSNTVIIALAKCEPHLVAERRPHLYQKRGKTTRHIKILLRRENHQPQLTDLAKLYVKTGVEVIYYNTASRIGCSHPNFQSIVLNIWGTTINPRTL
jgi:hypothetical protein